MEEYNQKPPTRHRVLVIVKSYISGPQGVELIPDTDTWDWAEIQPIDHIHAAQRAYCAHNDRTAAELHLTRTDARHLEANLCFSNLYRLCPSRDGFTYSGVPRFILGMRVFEDVADSFGPHTDPRTDAQIQAEHLAWINDPEVQRIGREVIGKHG